MMIIPGKVKRRIRRASVRGKATGKVSAVLVALLIFASGTLAVWITPQNVSTGPSTDNRHPQIALDSDGNPNVMWCG